MKKRELLKYLLAFLTVIFLLLALLSDYLASKSDNLGHTANQIQLVLKSKKELLLHDMEELQNRLTQTVSKRQRYKNISDFEEDLEKDGFALFAIKRNSLIFWSDKSFILPSLLQLSKMPTPVCKFNNGWYYLKKKRLGDIFFLGFILIKKEYPYSNKFLKNGFAPDYHISDNYNITTNRIVGEPIYDENQQYLFSIYRNDMDFSTYQTVNNSGIYYGVFFVLFLLLCSMMIRGIKSQKKGVIALLIWVIILISVRYVMLYWDIPSSFSQLEIFSPILFASSTILPSLGDFLINAFCIYLFVATLSKCCSQYFISSSISTRKRHFIFVGYNIAYWALFLLFADWLQRLVNDSSFRLQLFVFQENGFYVLVGFLIVVLLIYALGEIAFLIERTLLRNVKVYHYILASVLLAIIPVLYGYSVLHHTFLFMIAPLLVLILILFFKNKRNSNNKHSLHMLLMLLIAVITTYHINYLSNKKEEQERLVATMNLSSEYDPTSENLLVEMQKKIDQDALLKQLCSMAQKNEKEIINYLKAKYFTGYWEQFSQQFTICYASDDLQIRPDNSTQNCYLFFNEMLVQWGENIPNTNFYTLNEFDGIISYLGILTFNDEVDRRVRVFIRLDSKIGYEGAGYPDLLIDGKTSMQDKNYNYSFAKYRSGTLIASSGEFNYYSNSDIFGENPQTTINRVLDGYNHTLYRFENNLVVMSTPNQSWYVQLITIPYIFVLLYLVGFVVWLLSSYSWQFKLHLSFKDRIQYAIVGLLMLFFFVLVSGTVYYTIKQSNDENHSVLHDKLRLIKEEVENINLKNVPLLTNYLRRLSAIIYADIHVYDSSGRLITSSRMEIFNKQLQSPLMSFSAFSELLGKNKTSFIHQEKIGNLSYLSAYESILDANNQIIGYVNLPYFLKSEELKRKMFNLILAGINLHLLIILLAIILSVFLSNKLTRPLRLIQKRLKETRIGAYGEKVDYVNDDEIGELVTAYNEMQAELQKSAEKLALSERESAWREMARQIAHEIKNPLTPMKLSIQFLQRRFAEQSPDREEQLQKVSTTLIEQINTLSAIATAFSSFAKMPPANNQEQNLIAILEHVLTLFQSNVTNISLHLNGVEDASVYVDKERFIRVFVNLINNAIQAIPSTQLGEINITLKEKDTAYIVTVADNGMGITEAIKEKLFYPNFTTKSGGMGLGLAITKKIVENANGKIWVESEVGHGATFFVELPKFVI